MARMTAAEAARRKWEKDTDEMIAIINANAEKMRTEREEAEKEEAEKTRKEKEEKAAAWEREQAARDGMDTTAGHIIGYTAVAGLALMLGYMAGEMVTEHIWMTTFLK